MSRRFDGVIFDMGDILFDASLWRRWLATALQDLGVELDFDGLVELWEVKLVDVYRGRAAYWDRFDELLKDLGLEEGQRRDLSENARRKALEVQADRRPMPGVPVTLDRLVREGVRLAVLSDNESGSSAVRGVLRQLGIEQCFDAVITSADIGSVKPEPAAYAAATSSIGLEARGCVFVGHDEDELVGAREAGLCSVAYNNHLPVSADVYVERFEDLIAVVLGEDL